MRVFDSSSLVHAWDNYPIANFPRFWAWLGQQLTVYEILVSRVVFEEVGDVSPDCSAWLTSLGVRRVDVDNAIASQAQAIKAMLGIANDEYHPNGVDENDILIISTARCGGHSVISNEGRQPDLPVNVKKYKIPAVCALNGVRVGCNNIAEIIRQSNQIF